MEIHIKSANLTLKEFIPIGQSLTGPYQYFRRHRPRRWSNLVRVGSPTWRSEWSTSRRGTTTSTSDYIREASWAHAAGIIANWWVLHVLGQGPGGDATTLTVMHGNRGGRRRAGVSTTVGKECNELDKRERTGIQGSFPRLRLESLSENAPGLPQGWAILQRSLCIGFVSVTAMDTRFVTNTWFGIGLNKTINAAGRSRAKLCYTHPG